MKVKNIVMPPLVVHSGGIVVEEPAVQDETEQSPSVQSEDEEEKPVAPAGAEESEETHGGDEATDSIEGSPSVSKTGQEDREESESGIGEGKGAGQGDEAKDDEGEGKGDEGEAGSGGEAPENADLDVQTGDGTGEAPENDLDVQTEIETEKKDQSTKDQANEDEAAASNGNINATEVVKHEYVSISCLKQSFYRLVNDLADQRAGEEPGHEVLSMKRLVRRALDKRPLEKCKVNVIHEDIIVILDDSGSMEWWANLLNALATLCVKRKDVRVFWAPNGRINDPNWERQQGRGSIKIESFPASIRGLNVIYVGDFDGGDTPFILAKAGANVAWYCPENRYNDTSEHDWCHHKLEDYPKSLQFFWTLSMIELLHAFKKTRKVM